MRLVILAAAISAIAACGGSDDSFTGLTSEDLARPVDPAAVMLGSWELGCHQNAELGTVAKLTTTYTGNGRVVFKYDNYTDTGCVERGYTLHVEAVFAVKSEAILSSGDTVQQIEFSNHATYITLPDQGYADSYSQNNFCGRSNYEPNVRTAIGTCAPNNAVIYTRDIIKIDGDRMYEGSTPGNDTFPTALSGQYFSRM